MCQNTHFERRKGPIRAPKFTPRPPCLTAVDIYIYEKMIVNISLRMPLLDLITQHCVVNVEFEYFFLRANGITGQEIRSIHVWLE